MAYRSVQKGDRVSEYVLVEKIGEGGFGVVWKAEHAQIPGKYVAVKIPTSPEGMDYLKQEAVFQHELDHPNIVKTIGLDTKHDPPYFIMEYVDGRNLRQFMTEDGILPPPYAIDIAVQVCEALAFAHARGIVHKDIKPENILVEKKRVDISNKGKALLHYVKITDLGLGTLPGPSQSQILISDQARTSGVRILSGTLFYMAPELMAPGRPVDARSDLYSLGVVLYEMLTGELPLGMDLPSEMNPVVTPELDAICKKALSIDRDRRYATAREMAAELQKAKEAFLVKLVAQGTPALEPGGAARRLTPTSVPIAAASGPRARRRCCAGRPADWALAGAVLLLLAGAGVAFTKIRRAARVVLPPASSMAPRVAGDLIVETKPEEAEVSFDGAPAGASPARVASPSFSRHVVRIAKEFYAPRELVLEPARDGSCRFRILDAATQKELGVRDAAHGLVLEGIELRRLKGRVEITTPGVEKAEVRVDGDLYGVTPFSRELDAGEHLFEVARAGYKDVSFYEKVEGGAKIGRIIALRDVRGADPAPPSVFRVHVTSVPPDASVFVNDQERGRTPLDLELPSGRHQLRLVKKLFEPHAVELAVEGPGSREYELVRIQTRVAFDSEPRGATVYVDGEKIGVTPVSADAVAAGSHKAVFALPGHYDQSALFEVVNREPMDGAVKATLQRIPPGRLAVDCDIRGAEVFVDGRSAGRAPLQRTLDSGRHRIRVLGIERAAVVDPGAELKVSFGLRDLEMVLIREGEFRYGSFDARPGEVYARTERTGAFYMDQVEVTNEQYLLFYEHVRSTGDHSRCHPDEPRNQPDLHRPIFLNDPRYNGPRQPVVGVTWFDAFAYAAWAGKRLPTEIEWEKAARGTKAWTYPWGNEWEEGRCNASGKDDGHEFTAPVGVFGSGASPFLCFDMVGNAREWTFDDYLVRTGAKNVSHGKAIRGGSFLGKDYNTATMREYEAALHSSATLGFRCAADEKR
jgi:formylglycine-generating enzyme required for sulfatase activity/predicted Ser/Thr protein kinase